MALQRPGIPRMGGLSESPRRSAARPERRKRERMFPHSTWTLPGMENAGKNQPALIIQSHTIKKKKKKTINQTIYLLTIQLF